jgi:hypothetical protein
MNDDEKYSREEKLLAEPSNFHEDITHKETLYVHTGIKISKKFAAEFSKYVDSKVFKKKKWKSKGSPTKRICLLYSKS